MEKDLFIEEFVKQTIDGNSRIFVGAGISAGAGYPNWTKLVRQMAEEIELELTPETDLTGVVQYYLNLKQRDRLTEIVRKNINIEKRIPNVLRELAKLPIREIWTTNYDTLIERAWREQRREIEPIHRNEQLTAPRIGARTVLYKMHGTIENAHDVVISKYDFEMYREDRSGFTSVLAGQYIERTFLFLGLSFSDPNLAHLFAEMKRQFGENAPRHYTIVKRPQKTEIQDAQHQYENECRKLEHWKRDLENYGIRSIEVDDYQEIEEILEKINAKLPKPPIAFSTNENSRILIVEQPGTRLENHIEILSTLLGGIEYRLSTSWIDADEKLLDFEPNIVLINPRTLDVEESLNWIEAMRTSDDPSQRRIVFGIIQDKQWESETSVKILEHSFGERVRNHYTMKVIDDDLKMREEVNRFIACAHVDFALQLLDQSVTSILDGLDGKLTSKQVDKFAGKARSSIDRLDRYFDES